MRDQLISLVIPAKDEGPNLPGLLDEIEAAMVGRRFEVLVVDDGSTDMTASILASERLKRPFPLRHVRHHRSAGKSLALRSGAWAASGSIVATLDGDGQNDPSYVPLLVDALLQAGPEAGIAAGQRLRRTDGPAKRMASRFANGLRAAVLDDRTRDTACGLKAVHTDLLRRLPFFEGCHRFLPALVIQEGYSVVHLDVIDRPRRHGRSHYGIWDRGLRGLLDLIGVWWLRRRRHVPRVEEIV
jgi:glycosyltransferase involved in cell wall biosynthesis